MAARCFRQGWWHTEKIFVKKVYVLWERLSSREQQSIYTFSLLPVNQWERFEYDLV
jgi:hypothetical protein